MPAMSEKPGGKDCNCVTTAMEWDQTEVLCENCTNANWLFVCEFEVNYLGSCESECCFFCDWTKNCTQFEDPYPD